MAAEPTFTEQYPEFLDTSSTGAVERRLNLRYEMMIAKNRKILDGARIVDIASHDGRWAFAALMANASHVTGIEGRADLVDKANKTFAARGISSDRFTFAHGDVHDVLGRGGFQCDVVLCLGFIYHTLRYPELFSGIRKTGATRLILDTRVTLGTSRTINVHYDEVEFEKMAVEDRFSENGRALVGTPSIPALRKMLRLYGYEITKQLDWQSFLAHRGGAKSVRDYANGERATFVAERREPADESTDGPARRGSRAR